MSVSHNTSTVNKTANRLGKSGRKRNPNKVCKCGKPLRNKSSGYCRECHAAYMRAHRKPHSQLPEEQRKKSNARAYLRMYIKRGKVVIGVCEVCGEKDVQALQQDYSNPLDVIWLCKKHHNGFHKNICRPTEGSESS